MCRTTPSTAQRKFCPSFLQFKNMLCSAGKRDRKPLSMWRKMVLSTEECAFTITTSLYTNLFTTTTQTNARFRLLPSRPSCLPVEHRLHRDLVLRLNQDHASQTPARHVHAKSAANGISAGATVEKSRYIHRTACAERDDSHVAGNLSTFRSSSAQAFSSR
jgi:hypothetical protein